MPGRPTASGREACSLDRRAFLQSYDPAQDDEDHTILTRILQAVIPVCAGISLEYYFSCVDPVGWGAGNKLPHNITSLLGVMDGAASDLRPGLYQQMVEIHEPMRLLFVIETDAGGDPEQIMEQNEGIARLVRGHWVQLATLNATTGDIDVFRGEAVRTLFTAQSRLAGGGVIPRMVSRLARPSGICQRRR